MRAISASRHVVSSTRRLAALSSVRHLSSFAPQSPFSYASSPGVWNLPPAKNEPTLSFAPGSPDRAKLESAVKKLASSQPLDIPAVIGDKEIYARDHGGEQFDVTCPTDHQLVLARSAESSAEMAKQAIDSCMSARAAWDSLPFQSRAAIFLRAADLLAGKYRYEMLAAVMLGQGKNPWQAEIDGATEAIDFWRFNVHYAAQLFNIQPLDHSQTVWNRLEYRGLEGFVLAVTPFNFAAIGSNLSSAPALMGTSVIWKPSNTALLANWVAYKIMREAGLPPGVINFLPGHGAPVSAAAFDHPDFGGLHFTGSTRTFQSMWKTIGNNITKYKSYPRIVGETGGKNFHFIHASADVEQVVLHTIRSAFEFCGQKCSACSRLYVPESLWPKVKAGLVEHTQDIVNNHQGPVTDLSTFMGAVIDKASFTRISKILDEVKADAKSGKVDVLVGGEVDGSKGWFVQPTIIQAKDPKYRTMEHEIFGPVLTVYVYPDAEYSATLDLCDQTSPYGLTGSIFAQDRYALEYAVSKLRHAAGNFYINDKSTGAVVGQQPFGGARGSGTNDKAGAMQNLMRWTSPRSIKEALAPITTYKYPHNAK